MISKYRKQCTDHSVDLLHSQVDIRSGNPLDLLIHMFHHSDRAESHRDLQYRGGRERQDVL